MGITEIILLLLGIGIFVASFVLPEKKAKLSEETLHLGKERIQELVDAQMKEMQSKVSDAVEETITYAVEKTERSMERVTNEKMMAVNEYSTTVLEEIHKNHEEVVFLYDMLSDKQQSLKAAVAEADQRAKDTRAVIEQADASAAVQESAQEEQDKPVEITEHMTQKSGPESTAKKRAPRKTAADHSAQTKAADGAKEAAAQGTGKKRSARKNAVKETAGNDRTETERANELPRVNLSFADDGENGRNNNERILALHKAGKSNVAIAKELGLGIGEVKLVIDLFKGV